MTWQVGSACGIQSCILDRTWLVLDGSALLVCDCLFYFFYEVFLSYRKWTVPGWLMRKQISMRKISFLILSPHRILNYPTQNTGRGLVLILCSTGPGSAESSKGLMMTAKVYQTLFPPLPQNEREGLANMKFFSNRKWTGKMRQLRGAGSPLEWESTSNLRLNAGETLKAWQS